MHVTDGPVSGIESDETKWGGARQASPEQQLDVILKPLARPELGELRIDDAVFAVGRAEQPFASFGNDILSMLSRRHARIFREGGAVYLADLGSRNGTTVNRAAVVQTPCQLRDGDELCFGGVLSYRAQITPRATKSRPDGGLALALTPESAGAGLDVIVVTRFPFLISKGDATFSRYKNKHARELSYLSRRQAYIYQKNGQPYIEDLASGNGTFVDGLRLQEHAVPLHEGVLVAFGGDHFVYRVGITRDPVVAPPPGGTREPMIDGQPEEPQTIASDKTEFVAAPTSFLDIFCAVEEPGQGDAAIRPAGFETASATAAAKDPPVKRKPRGRAMVLVAELASMMSSGEPDAARRIGSKAGAVAAVLIALALTAYFWDAPERELKDAIARGDDAQAAVLADRLLDKRPDDVDLKAQATEAALKADVPVWLAKLQAGDFDGAKGVLAGLSALGKRNSDLRPLVDELEWLGGLERRVGARGGPEAPIRIYADEDDIESLIGRWNDNTGEHQRELARIASYVPQFSDKYGEALTHLRRLQSDASVYLPVIDRLKATIAAELKRDDPEALEAPLKESAEKYPRLGGLDGVRQDLARYLEIRREARSPGSGRLFALLHKARFTTPPFQQGFRTLAASGQLPSADLVQQYDAATQAWKDGHADQALSGLQQMATGPWLGAASRELERRQGVASRFAALQPSRGAGAGLEQLLAFRESLDPDEDVYFVRATAADLDAQRDKVIARARDSMNRARAQWQEYRNSGAIDASQRIETSISDTFRTRARLLSGARRDAQQGMQIYAQVDAAGAEQWAAIRDEIQAEARQQRRALEDLRNVLEPGLLKSKLALLGDAGA